MLANKAAPCHVSGGEKGAFHDPTGVSPDGTPDCGRARFGPNRYDHDPNDRHECCCAGTGANRHRKPGHRHQYDCARAASRSPALPHQAISTPTPRKGRRRPAPARSRLGAQPLGKRRPPALRRPAPMPRNSRPPPLRQPGPMGPRKGRLVRNRRAIPARPTPAVSPCTRKRESARYRRHQWRECR